MTTLPAAFEFALDAARHAAEPPEVRGTGRDDVRLLVTDRRTGDTDTRHFRDLPEALRPGDLLVVNNSTTLPAAVWLDRMVVHFSTRQEDGRWLVEPRRRVGRGHVPYADVRAGEHLPLPGGVTLRLAERYSRRLWFAELDTSVPIYLMQHGKPIRYDYVGRDWPLSAYQTVFGTVDGSAEMPSAARPFTADMVTALVSRGIGIAPVTLHTGVASPEADEPPYPEWFQVTPRTAAAVRAAKSAGGRVIAVGTTVVRALESAAASGTFGAAEGTTSLVVTPERGVHVVDGIVTGLHEPRSTHLAMLSAVADAVHLRHAYREAIAHGLLWHEFGDLHLIALSVTSRPGPPSGWHRSRRGGAASSGGRRNRCGPDVPATRPAPAVKRPAPPVAGRTHRHRPPFTHPTPAGTTHPAVHRFPRSVSAGLTGLAALSLMTPLAAPAHAETPDDAGFHRLATFPVYLNGSPDEVTAAEIAAVTEDGETVVYTDSPAGALGFVDITDPAAPQPAGRFTLDGEPTSVAVAGGRILAAVNTGTDHAHPDGELAVFDAATREPVATVALGGQPDSIAVDPSHRWAAIAIENERDEDVADGDLPQAPAGRLAVVDLHDLTVTDVDLTGLAEVAPDDPEPEYVSVNEDGVAVVTLQENNHIALVDLATATVVGDFSAGSARVSGVDVADDGRIALTGTVDAVREPDSVAWIGTEFIATANEGDWRGGTRGWTVFDTRGEVVHDSGNGFEYLGISHGLYPDKRSDSAGTEPEGLTVGTFDGVPHLFVASERGNFIAVYDVTDPASPRFRQLLPTGNEPEGLVTVPERDLLVVANELDEAESGIRSTVQIYRMDTGTPVFPSIVSDTVDGVPLGWGALSGLSASPTDPDALYAVTDSAFAHTRLLDVDVSTSPARITGATEVTRDGSPVGYDAEGVFARPEGGFWLASEGSPEDGVPNLLVRLNAEAEVVEEIPLPEDVAAEVTGRGLEGVTAFGSGDDEVVWVALQSPLSGGEDALLGRYEVSTGAWSWAGYALESATGDAATGLSEITATGPNTVAVIERDGAGGPDATVKRIHEIDLSEVRTGTADQAPRVDAQEAVDVLPVLRRGAGWTPDKLEGLAVAGNGRVYVVTDNDFVDDATGETVFADLGDATALFGTGGDGDLPVTGNSLTTIVVSAVLLVAVGSVALLILRRRALSRW